VFSFNRNIENSKHIENSIKINSNNGNNKVDKNDEVSEKIINEKRTVIGKDIDDKVLVLIYFLVFLPILVFITFFLRFYFFVKSHYKKLYGSLCDEGAFFKFKKMEIENIEKKKQEINNIEKQNQEKYRHKEQEFNMVVEACRILIKTIKSDSDKDEKALQELKDMLDLFIKEVEVK